MPKNFKEIFTALASKAGMDVKSEDFVNAVNAPDFERLTLPDEIFTGIDNGLLNMETAKGNHPAIKSHYYAQAYDMIDKTVLSAAQEEKFDEATINELKQITSTTEKVKFWNRKLKEHEAKKANTSKVDKQTWEQERAEFQEAIRLAKEEAPKVRAEMDLRLREKDMTFAKRQALARLKTVDDDLDPEVRTAMHEAILGSALRKAKAKFDVDSNGELQLIGEDGSTVYDDTHRKLDASAFMEKAFADTKRLKINEPATPPAANQYQQPSGQAPVITGQKAASSAVTTKNAQARADFEAAMTGRAY